MNFGAWALDTDRRLLTRDGAPVPLSPKAFDLLTLLARHREKAISKQEIHQQLWPETFVSDNNLTILVTEIRGVLGDSADEPKYVRTVRRFGYEFCAPVIQSDAADGRMARQSNGWLIWGDKSIGLREGETLLGRATEAHIRFEVPGVSRRHARILVDRAKVTLEDLGSQNGTYLQGERISNAVLKDGDEIRLGPVSIVFRLVSADNSTVPI